MKTETLRLHGSEGLTLVADARGDRDAPSVLFMHGGGQTRHSWGDTAELIAREGRYTVNLDLRGHGDSAWSPTGRYVLEAFVEDALRILETFQRPPVIVGASLGGVAGLVAVGEHKPKVSGLVLVDISPRIEKDGAARISDFMRANPDGFENLEAVADAVAGYTRRQRKRNLKGLEKNVRRGPDGRYRWHWDPKFIQSVDGPREVSNQNRLMDAARSLQLPTLLVRGRLSDLLSPQGAREFLEAVPHAEFADVAGAGHMVAGDQNDAFTESVRTFLQKIPAED